MLQSMESQRVRHNLVTEQQIHMYIYMCICSSAGKESACHVGDLGLILGLGRSPGEGNGYPLPYSGLENSMDRGAC